MCDLKPVNACLFFPLFYSSLFADARMLKAKHHTNWKKKQIRENDEKLTGLQRSGPTRVGMNQQPTSFIRAN